MVRIGRRRSPRRERCRRGIDGRVRRRRHRARGRDHLGRRRGPRHERPDRRVVIVRSRGHHRDRHRAGARDDRPPVVGHVRMHRARRARLALPVRPQADQGRRAAQHGQGARAWTRREAPGDVPGDPHSRGRAPATHERHPALLARRRPSHPTPSLHHSRPRGAQARGDPGDRHGNRRSALVPEPHGGCAAHGRGRGADGHGGRGPPVRHGGGAVPQRQQRLG